MTDTRSIEAYGLKKFLDGSRWKHFDNGYDEFVRMLNEKNPRIPIVEIAKHFNVDRRTISNWIEQLRKEESNAKR